MDILQEFSDGTNTATETSRYRRWPNLRAWRPALAAGILLVVTGCSSAPLKVDYDPAPAANGFMTKKAATIVVTPFTDARKDIAGDPRIVGRVTTNVFMMDGGPLRVADDIPAIVDRALVTELTAAGYSARVLNSGDAKDADFVLGGEIRAFNLSAENDNSVDIAIAARLTDAKTGQVLWTGMEADKHTAFIANPFGTSRSILHNYLNYHLAKVARQTVADMGAAISVPAAPAIASQPPAEGVRASTAALATAAPATSGRLTITSTPSHAKTYLNGIYYGLTPIEIDMDAGTYDLQLVLTGYMTLTEKIAVRKGHETPVEENLEVK